MTKAEIIERAERLENCLSVQLKKLQRGIDEQNTILIQEASQEIKNINFEQDRLDITTAVFPICTRTRPLAVGL